MTSERLKRCDFSVLTFITSNTESGIRQNLGTGSGIAEEHGIRDGIDRCSGFGMIVKRSGTAGSSGRVFTGSEKR